MKKTEAKKMITEFVNKYRGKSVLFNTLNDTEREAYVLTQTFNYFRSFLKASEAIERAISNTEAHKSSHYEVFASRVTEHMTIAKV